MFINARRINECCVFFLLIFDSLKMGGAMATPDGNLKWRPCPQSHRKHVFSSQKFHQATFARSAGAPVPVGVTQRVHSDGSCWRRIASDNGRKSALGVRSSLMPTLTSCVV